MTLEMRDLENQEIGEKKGEKNIILKMLKKGKSPEEIADLCDITISEVQAIQDEELLAMA